MAQSFTYDFQNKVRDVDEVFRTIIVQQPSLLSMVAFSGRDGTIPEQQQVISINEMMANSYKHEWVEDILSPDESTINNSGAITNTDLTFVVVSVAPFKVGDILRFENSTTTYDEQMIITAINTATKTITVNRGTGTASGQGYLGTTRETSITDGTKVIRVSAPEAQASDPDNTVGSDHEPDINYNFCQIFQETTGKIGRSTINQAIYGTNQTPGDIVDYKVQVALQRLAWQMNEALMNGRRTEPASGQPGIAGGLHQFISNEVDAASSNLSSTILNNALEQTMLKGGMPKVLVGNTNQFRKISSFSSDSVRLIRTERGRGEKVYNWQGDIPIEGSRLDTFIVDMRCRKDTLYLIDPARIAVVPLRNRSFQDENTAPNGADYAARRVLGEYTFVIKNGANSHCKITNLAR